MKMVKQTKTNTTSTGPSTRSTRAVAMTVDDGEANGTEGRSGSLKTNRKVLKNKSLNTKCIFTIRKIKYSEISILLSSLSSAKGL